MWKSKVQKIIGIRLVLLMIILSAPVLFNHCSKKSDIEKKQIILISLDALRADHLSSYGYFRDTSPNLSKLIENSAYYVNAYPNGCWTIPSHMSLLTGTLPSRHGINRDAKTFKSETYPMLNKSVKTLAEFLKSRGINTIKFANLLPKGIGFGRGFDKNNWIDPFYNNERFDKLCKEIEINKEESFLLFIHTWKIHAPYTHSYFLKEGKVSSEKREFIDNFRQVRKKKKSAFEDFRQFLIENRLYNVDDCMALYDSGIRCVDQYIGKLIKKLKELGIYHNVLLVIFSDHGEHFGEHYPKRFYGNHGSDFYEEYIKIPLIIKYPYTSESKRLKQPVSLIDIYPTILDFYKFEIPAMVQGNSLLKPPPPPNKKYIISEAVTSDLFERKMIRLGNFKYIVKMKDPSKHERENWNKITERRLFDLKKDPLEKDNLYKKLKFKAVCIKLEKLLKKLIDNSAKMRLKTGETKIDKETLGYLESLGYIK